MKLYARKQGQGQNLVSVHGLFGSLDNLGAVNRTLAENYCVHALDLRNHGRSPHSDSMQYSDMAADLVEYLDDQNIDSAHLLGHSMGGKVVMETALRYPDRVDKVSVLDISPVAYTVRRHDDVFAGLKAVDFETLQRRSEADAVLAGFISEPGVRQFLLKNLYKNDQGQFGWRLNLSAIEQSYVFILGGQQAETSFPGDVLFLKAGLSDYILPEHQDTALSLFPNAIVRIIPGTGHWLHAEKPELVAGALQRFYQSD